MSEKSISDAIRNLQHAAGILDRESHNTDLNFSKSKFLNMAYKETKQLELELRAFLGHFPVSQIQEVGVIEKFPSLKILEKIVAGENTK